MVVLSIGNPIVFNCKIKLLKYKSLFLVKVTRISGITSTSYYGWYVITTAIFLV